MFAVVGGGYAGLAAGYRLVESGLDVTLFEASDHLGGLAAAYETDGDPIERYYHHLSKSEQTIIDVIETLGLDEQLSWRVGTNAYYVDGQVHPLNTLWQIAAYPHLSFYDKFRLGMLTLGLDLRSGLPKRGVYEDYTSFDSMSVKEFILEHTTKSVYRSFFEPLLRAKFGSRMEDVSAAWLLGRIHFRSERDLRRGEVLGYLDGGFQQLTQSLVDAVGRDRIETGASVTDIRLDRQQAGERRVRSIEVDTGTSTEDYAVDGVIVATMPHVLQRLTGYQHSIDFQGTVCSLIATDEPVIGAYWLNIADEAPFGALIEHTEFVPRTRYGGEHLLYAVRYVQDLKGQFWQHTDAEIEARWLEGIESLFPSFERSSVEWIKTSRNPRTAPIYDCGYIDRIIPYDLADEVAQGVYYAGMGARAQYPERSLNGAIEAGFEAANRLRTSHHQ